MVVPMPMGRARRRQSEWVFDGWSVEQPRTDVEWFDPFISNPSVRQGSRLNIPVFASYSGRQIQLSRGVLSASACLAQLDRQLAALLARFIVERFWSELITEIAGAQMASWRMA